ncbi:spindle pole body component 110-like isoform X1 [Bombus vosnesenskii]|uniref:Spindle pole body component 110-like isoform X1 n=2 Tax=Pyrobombus TaxID=144703 RepID=A0A6J3LK24_9HYME|nr:spindle pole body component 110-like isoform X1 [Bombus vosnesenskii]
MYNYTYVYICKYFVYVVEDSVVAFNVKQDMTNSNEIEFDDISNTVNNKNLLSEIANNLDSCGLQKEYHNYTIKLSRKDVIDNIEKEIIEYFTHFLIKLRSLTQKLQIYVEIERPVMIQQTYYFYKIMKDTQSAINVSQDITLKKQLISELYNQHKKENKKYDSCIKQLPNDLLHIQNKINEFIENILYQLLNEILHTEETYLYDEKINKAIEIHLKSCINKINTALQGAGDQHIQITGTIEEQQNELKRKNLEIAQLKEVVQQQRGEGIGLNEENIKIKEQLSKITTALNKKDDHVLKLEQQLEILKSDLFIYDKDCNALKKENKNLENITNRLSEECCESKKQLIIKTKQIKNLSEQVRELLETKNLKTTLENKIKEIEKRLSDLQFENYELEKNIIQSNMIISTKEEAITTLKNKIDASNNILSQKIGKYKNAMEQKHHEIIRLEDENILLNEKLKDVEHKLIEMNLIIVSLTEQNDKINIIYTMQEDLTKLDKYEKKLKVELSNLRTQLINDQNSNKKLDNSLDIYLHENEILEKNVEYWKNENSELLIRLHNEVMEENLKSKLYTLSNQIYERLLSLQNLSNLEKDSSNSKFIKKLHDQYIIHQDEIIELTVNNRIKNFKLEYKDQKREVKETEIEKIDVQLSNNVNIKEVPENNCITFERSNSPNNLLMRYKIEHMKSEHNENQNEIMNRDGEIKHPKEIIKHLVQENAELRAILKSQMEEYQDKIMLMKRNYDSSLNAVCERHKANVEILQKQFEDDMKSEKIFDSENWLLSLNMKELMGLHEQITVIINNSSDVIHMENENKCLYDNAQEEFYATLNEVEKKFQILPTNVHEEESMYKRIISSISKERNSHIQNQWQFMPFLGDAQKYQTLQTQDYKSNLGHNFGYHNGEEKSPELENKSKKDKQIEKDFTFDQQRWNFINQCSAYHKLSNIYEYTTFPTN